MTSKMSLTKKLLIGAAGATGVGGIGVGGIAIGYKAGKDKERKVLGDAFAGANEIENNELARKFYQLGQESTKMANYNDDVFMQIKVASYNDELEKIAIMGIGTSFKSMVGKGGLFGAIGTGFKKGFGSAASKNTMRTALQNAKPALLATGAGLGTLGVAGGAMAIGRGQR